MNKQNLKQTLTGLFVGITLCALISMCCTSCTTTRYVNVPEYHEKIVNHHDSVNTRDSIYLHDSIFTFMKGDTVSTIHWKTKYIEHTKYISKLDTICVHDSIVKPVVETVTKKDKSGWVAFWFVFIAAVLGAFASLYEHLKK